MSRVWTLILLLFCASPALAGGIAIVDFQRAVTDTREGKEAQSKLDSMYSQKKSEIERMRSDLESSIKDYQSRANILTPDARMSAEQDLMEKQRRYEATYMQYQGEMQQTYMTLLQGLDEKMRALTKKIAKEKGYDLVMDAAMVVYSGPTTADMTEELIRRYNAQ